MDRNHLHELIKTEKNYWWHVSKRGIVKDLLKQHFPPPASLIECGFGGGWNLSIFQNLGYEVMGLDLLQEAIDNAKNRGIKNVIQHDLSTPWPVNYESQDVILMLDVLEHLAEPVGALRNAKKVMKRGGGIIITVPAIPYIMGPWDVKLGHYRRYSIKLLRKHTREADLSIDFISFWNAYSLPLALIMRVLEKMINYKRSSEFPKISPLINSFLIQFGDIERRFMQKSFIPFGLSLVALLK